MRTINDYIKGLYDEYQKVLSMSEDEVLVEYEDTKANVVKDYKCLIDEFENNDKVDDRMVYDVDSAFNSWLSVNSMFV